MPLSLSVVTAERTILNREDVQRLVVPTTEGQITVLPSHAPLMSSIGYGALTAYCLGEVDVMAVFGGFLQVANNQVIVLADAAERPDQIDEQRAEAARNRAVRRIAGELLGGEQQVDLARARLALARATIRLRVAQARRNAAA